jgi:hypothetical protein
VIGGVVQRLQRAARRAQRCPHRDRRGRRAPTRRALTRCVRYGLCFDASRPCPSATAANDALLF